MIGKIWESQEGKRKIEGLFPLKDGSMRYGVSTDGSRSMDLFTPEEIEAQIAFEIRKGEEKREANKRRESEIAIEAEQKRIADDTDGYADQFPLMQRGRVIATLLKTVVNGGRVWTRKDLIRAKVADGWKVTTFNNVRMLKDVDGWYLDAKAITKIGLDYAEYLSEQLIAYKL